MIHLTQPTQGVPDRPFRPVRVLFAILHSVCYGYRQAISYPVWLNEREYSTFLILTSPGVIDDVKKLYFHKTPDARTAITGRLESLKTVQHCDSVVLLDTWRQPLLPLGTLIDKTGLYRQFNGAPGKTCDELNKKHLQK